MRQDTDTYDYHCGECDSDRIDWIDYEPDSKKGLANRKKYCRPAVPADWDPVAELEKICEEFDHLVADQAPWTPVRTKPAITGVYECEFAKQPAWPWPPTQKLTWTGKKWVNDAGDTVKGVKQWREREEAVA
jgi:hypothetical protein